MKLSKEEWDELSDVEQLERAEEKPEEIVTPAPEGETGVSQEEVDEKGVPLKNRLAEKDRKLAENEKRTQILETELAEMKKSIQSKTSSVEKDVAVSDFKQKLTDMNYEPEMVDELLKTVKFMAQESNRELMGEINTLKMTAAKNTRAEILRNLQAEDDLGLIAKYKVEINAELDTYDPILASNPVVIDVAVARVQKKHLRELLGKKEKSGSAIETSPASGASVALSDGNELEAKKYSALHGIDLKRARTIIEKRNMALKSQK
ncbi:MAG: hypothetical protein FP827_06685 [Candidatus Omnitrophica bacterium]|nr:hypothetical protein [Candidatus Omnitrophota bacterium]